MPIVLAWMLEHWIVSTLLGLHLIGEATEVATGKSIFAGKTTFTETVFPNETGSTSMSTGTTWNLNSSGPAFTKLESNNVSAVQPTVTSGPTASATVGGPSGAKAIVKATFADGTSSQWTVTVR